ncbi:MAG TPA: lipid A biosynthesis acyltransferase [Sulfurihydrogenibium sp.]|uniref:lysophospholipid acyltransferase family protein n=1 Tax=Sulfurihydrogenibium sp. (strain YO3AOP1) TaxID=436114 RepID=UPI0001723F43|nr:lysophospholipid acyltransferase family protein [Sulfurihydrogenibium sp. YO3AOP1]ACD66136.1 lipid A biosynthesis acyltransferase [Sulfurihydrogenibium sp. YO3AOP1]HBT99204.1 lipid A biosynthesis acyltransferase [Sulfurihydrogenibium sp.]
MLEAFVKLYFNYIQRKPREKALKLAEKIGKVLYLLNYRKDVIHKNLDIAFPGKDYPWKEEIRKKTLINIGRVLVEFPKQPQYVKSGEIKNIFIITKGFEELKSYLGKGAIVVSGHISSWEMCGAGLSAYLGGMTSLAYRQKNQKINDLITKIRQESGIKIIFHDQPLKIFISALNKGEIISFLVDQNALRHRGYFVDFFGLKASTVNFPAKLAVKYKVPIFFAYTYFDENHSKYFCEIEKLEYNIGKDSEETAYNIVQAYTKKVEEAVRKHPDQYLWVHKRWKTRENEKLEKIY